MIYKQQIEQESWEAYKKGVDFGATGRDGTDNSYDALIEQRKLIEYLAKKQGINLKD